MINIDSLIKNATTTYIDGKWVTARPVPENRVFERLKDAFQVILGKADAVKFYKQ